MPRTSKPQAALRAWLEEYRASAGAPAEVCLTLFDGLCAGSLRGAQPLAQLLELLNVLSGLAEIVLGVYVLEPRVRVLAAWGIIALLVAVFPANVYVALENVGTDGPGTGAGAANWVRLPFQALFIVWAWWYTRPDAAEG